MATTTASVTLSSDLLSDALNVSASTTCVKGGTTADGLDQMDYGYIDIATGTNFDLLDANNSGLNNDKANKVYIANHSTDDTFYVVITIDSTEIGRLYAGDWMFIPADFHDGDADIEITAIGATQKIEYALFHEGTALVGS